MITEPPRPDGSGIVVRPAMPLIPLTRSKAKRQTRHGKLDDSWLLRVDEVIQ